MVSPVYLYRDYFGFVLYLDFYEVYAIWYYTHYLNRITGVVCVFVADERRIKYTPAGSGLPELSVPVQVTTVGTKE